ncbi:unnamed protein product [Amoebophrya sp. A25]|nr:unnamed protein product [Amoebophrya sp. A25]|eukprot:GSA25T00003323001.1
MNYKKISNNSKATYRLGHIIWILFPLCIEYHDWCTYLELKASSSYRWIPSSSFPCPRCADSECPLNAFRRFDRSCIC